MRFRIAYQGGNVVRGEQGIGKDLRWWKAELKIRVCLNID